MSNEQTTINIKKLIEQGIKEIDLLFEREIQPIIVQAESILQEVNQQGSLRDFREFYPHLDRDKAFKAFVIRNANKEELRTYVLEYQDMMYKLFGIISEKDNQLSFYNELIDDLLDYQEQQTTHIKNLSEAEEYFKTRCRLVKTIKPTKKLENDSFCQKVGCDCPKCQKLDFTNKEFSYSIIKNVSGFIDEKTGETIPDSEGSYEIQLEKETIEDIIRIAENDYGIYGNSDTFSQSWFVSEPQPDSKTGLSIGYSLHIKNVDLTELDEGTFETINNLFERKASI